MKYPIKRRNYKKYNNSSNLGMNLEYDLDITNKFYLNNNIAVIYKKPTPIQVVNVNYPSRNKAKITKAYYKTPSTTDYNGIYKGLYIDFDAKETKSKTSFPLRNIQKHQMTHLININNHGGIAFLIVNFKFYNEYYFLPFDLLYTYWSNQSSGGRKSIPYSIFKEKAYPIKLGYHPRLDYLKIIDKYYIKTPNK